MRMHSSLHENVLITFTFAVALILTVLPLPHWIVFARPEWVFILLLFWLMHAPHKIGPIIAWFLGLYMDLLLGTVLGMHALIYVVFAYIIQKFLRGIQAMPLWQCVLGVGFCTFLSIVVQCFFLYSIEKVSIHSQVFLPVLTSMLFWPWLYFLCRDVRSYGEYRLMHTR